MGVRLMVEILDHWQDAGLTVGERSDLLVLAENANDRSRLTFGPVHAEYILRRAGKTAESWRVAISKLAKKGVLEHATRDGRPMRGHTGQYAVYRLVPLCPDPPHSGYKGQCAKPVEASSVSRKGQPAGDPSSGLGYPADNPVDGEEGYPAATPTEPSDNPLAREGYPAATERVIQHITPTPPNPSFKIPSTTPSTSPAEPVEADLPAVPAGVTDGGGGGDPDLRSLATHIAASLNYRGKPPTKTQRKLIEDRLLIWLEAGWSMDGLAVVLDITGQDVRYAPALYAMRLDPAEMPAPAPVPAPAAARGGVFGDLPSAEVIEATTVESLFYGEEPTVAPSRTWPEAEARAARLMATKTTAGGAGGTDDTVAGWRAVRDDLAAREPHKPYSDDPWRQPADPAEAAAIPWCGELECDPVMRMRDVEVGRGLKVSAPCEKCHPKMRF